MVRIHQNTVAWFLLAVFLLPYGMLALASTIPLVHAQPFSIRIFTYPVANNARFTLDNSSVTFADANGTATFDVFPGVHHLAIAQSGSIDSNRMYSFDRWGDLPSARAILPERKLNVTQSVTLLALVRLSYRENIRFTYNNTVGQVQPVDNSIVDGVHFISSSGIPVDVKTFDNAWFPANRFQRIQGGWKILANNYTADQVYVNGVNAIQHGKQTFSPYFLGPSSTWTLNLQLYVFTVVIRDLFFGTKVNGEVYVKSTNGTLVDRTNTSGGVATFPTLPRGYYSVGAKGLLVALPVPVIFSKPGSLELRVFSLTDMMIVGLPALLILYMWNKKRRTSRMRGGRGAPKLSGWEDGDNDWDR